MTFKKLADINDSFRYKGVHPLELSELQDILSELDPVDWKEFTSLVRISIDNPNSLFDTKFRNFAFSSETDGETLSKDKKEIIIDYANKITDNNKIDVVFDDYYTTSTFLSLLEAYLYDLETNLSDEQIAQLKIKDAE